MLAAVGATGLLAAAWARVERAPVAVAALLLALWCGYGFVAHPVLDASSSSAALMQRAREIAGPGTHIGLVGWKEQNLLQARGPTAEFGFRAPRELQMQRAVAWLRSDPTRRRLLLSQPQRHAECFAGAAESPRSVGAANRRGWYLVPLGAIGPRCQAGSLDEDGP